MIHLQYIRLLIAYATADDWEEVAEQVGQCMTATQCEGKFKNTAKQQYNLTLDGYRDLVYGEEWFASDSDSEDSDGNAEERKTLISRTYTRWTDDMVS